MLGGGSASQSDWSVNDPEDVSYIKNRPMYKELVPFEYIEFNVGAEEIVSVGAYVPNPEQYLGETITAEVLVGGATAVLEGEVSYEPSLPVYFVSLEDRSGEEPTTVGVFIMNFDATSGEPSNKTCSYQNSVPMDYTIKVLVEAMSQSVVQIPDEYVDFPKADWDSTNRSDKNYISNKPAFSVSIKIEGEEPVHHYSDYSFNSDKSLDFKDSIGESGLFRVVYTDEYASTVGREYDDYYAEITQQAPFIVAEVSLDDDNKVSLLDGANMSSEGDWLIDSNSSMATFNGDEYISKIKYIDCVKQLDDKYLKSSGGSTNPNWNENDTTSPTYIENRPFYTEDDGTVHQIPAEYVPKTYVTIGQRDGSTLGEGATAEGIGNVASGAYSHAEGIGEISGQSGDGAVGMASHTEGYFNAALGTGTHAEGAMTKAGVDANTAGAHSEGVFSSALAQASHAEGYGGFAVGVASHAEGGFVSNYNSPGTKATGASAHAEGAGTIAYGKCSHAGGFTNHALGDASFVYGQGNVASVSSELAGGEYGITYKPGVLTVQATIESNRSAVTITGGTYIGFLKSVKDGNNNDYTQQVIGYEGQSDRSTIYFMEPISTTEDVSLTIEYYEGMEVSMLATFGNGYYSSDKRDYVFHNGFAVDYKGALYVPAYNGRYLNSNQENIYVKITPTVSSSSVTDTITVTTGWKTYTLSKPNLSWATEMTVTLDGSALTANDDYAVDMDRNTIELTNAPASSGTLSVTYTAVTSATLNAEPVHWATIQ